MSHIVFFAFLVADISALLVIKNDVNTGIINEPYAYNYHIMGLGIKPAHGEKPVMDLAYSNIDEGSLKKCTDQS